MAESTLSSQYDDFREAIAHYLGMSLTSSSWSTNDEATIAMILKRGLRQFYYPPRLYPNEAPHQWSFLKPVETLATVATYSTGTIAIAITETTVTLTTGTWPSWAATHGTLVVDGTHYEIASRTSNSEIELSSAWTEDTETAATYSLQHDGNYDLDDDFGGIDGRMSYEPAENKADIQIVGEGKIRSLRSVYTTRSNPVYAAIRPKKHAATTVGQRFEVMFYPIPNDAYTLSYRKIILPSALVETTLTYPYGGAMHAETIEASCLAIAELQENEVIGVKHKYFMERLSASIEIDKTAYRTEYFGYNGDNSDAIHRADRFKHERNSTVDYESNLG